MHTLVQMRVIQAFLRGYIRLGWWLAGLGGDAETKSICALGCRIELRDAGLL